MNSAAISLPGSFTGSGWIRRYLLLAVRFWFGGFNLISGLNYFVRIWEWPQIGDSLGARFVAITVEMGLFQAIKIVEIVTGACILLNLFMPLALIVLFPVTLLVFYMNVFISTLAHIQMSGTRGLVFHLILMMAYARYYLPLVKVKAIPQRLTETAQQLPRHL